MTRLRSRIVAVAAALVALGGCAGIPQGGPVTKVNADQGSDQSTVRYSPARPAKDASPQQIVRGYLDAMLAYPVTTGVAASFLTPEAAKAWKSSAGVGIYVRPEVSQPVLAGGGGEVNSDSDVVNLNVVEDARLDRQGRFARVNSSKDFAFHLVKNAGQWRIDNPQKGFLVNRKFFDDYYRPFNAFYFDRTGKRLVADPIYLHVGDQLTTALVSSLLIGPGTMFAGTTRTYVPVGAQLRTSVPLRGDGLADVQFRDDLTSLSNASQERLSAQVVWALRQVPEITGVRISGDDNVIYPGNRGIQSIDSWQAFGPRFGDGTFYGIQDDRVVQLDRRAVAPVDGPWGKDAHGARSLSVDSDNVAAVTRDGAGLMIGSLGQKAFATIPGNGFLKPQWDDTRHVWAVDRPGGKTRIRVTNGKSTRTLAAARLGAFTVESFALSPDSSRYALLAEVDGTSQVFVGPVIRDDEDLATSLSTPVPVQVQDSNITNFRAISWATDTSVTFLADDQIVGTQIFESRIDGSQILGGTASSGALLPDVAAQALATVGGDGPIRYVTDAQNHTWLLRPGSNWERLSQRGIRALTASTTTPTR